MKTIFKIARTELQKLFYSPIAWLILVIFTFQSSMAFNDTFEYIVRAQALRASINNITNSVYATNFFGLFPRALHYVYLYIPLLTMGIMSLELGNGSIKLLYSSPVTNKQIILGKYLALMLFGLIMISSIAIFALYGILTINNVDSFLILCGLLGVYLLICAYAAIGLFMSSLTTYTVVAAIGTLAVFAMLAYVRGVGQGIEFVRDVTYWLAISNRAESFVQGMITSEDLLYFIIVIVFFLCITTTKLQLSRQAKKPLHSLGIYTLITLITMFLGYLTTIPSLKSYLDVTKTKSNTLTKSSQEVVRKLKGGLTITTYVNMLDPYYFYALPDNQIEDFKRFEDYIRFKPDIKLKYVYYYHKAENDFLDKTYPKLSDKQRYDTLKRINNWKFDAVPYSSISGKVELSTEKFRLVRLLEREDGQKTFLRTFNDSQRLPSESEITAAFKRLVMSLPTVGFLTGHGERGSTNNYDRGYNKFAQEKTFRYALINQGFDFQNVTLDNPIPQKIRILLISQVKANLNIKEKANLDDFIARGGNMIILSEPTEVSVMNKITDPLGVRIVPGTLVKPSIDHQPSLLPLKPTQQAIKFSPYFESMSKVGMVLPMSSTSGLELIGNKGFNMVPLFTSDTTGSWNKLDSNAALADSVSFDSSTGEIKRYYPTVVALSRKVKGKTQKIIISGDADWLSNSELFISRDKVFAGNFRMISGVFSWLSDGEVPIDMSRDTPPDNSVKIGQKTWAVSDIMFKWVYPSILAIIGLLIWVRRKGR